MLKFSITQGEASADLGATDPSISLESKGFLWWLIVTGSGLIEPSEYDKPLQELLSAGYLLMKDEDALIVQSSPFALIQGQVFFCPEHPLNCRQRKGKKVTLGSRFFPRFQETYNRCKAPMWASCDSQTTAREKALGDYLQECKRRRQGEFLVYGLDVFERALLFASGDSWWSKKRHSIGVFLKLKSDHPFDLAERYIPGTLCLEAAATASSWAATGKSNRRLLA